MEEGNTVVNALVGAVATGLLVWVPFSPLLGGLLAGYLQGGDRADGLTVGFLAGVVVLLPVLLIGALVATSLSVVIGNTLDFLPFAVGGFFLVFAFFFFAIYTIGLSTLGGWLGNYSKYETDVEL